MPLHDWTRAEPSVFADFMVTWLVELKRVLRPVLPDDHFALIQPTDCAPAQKTRRLEIRDEGNRLAACVEVIGPSIKSEEGTLGRFVERAVELLRGGCHLLTIDLYPPGRHDPNGTHSLIWAVIGQSRLEVPADKNRLLASYQADRNTQAYLEPLGIGDPLPTMPLFLHPGRYVTVNLEGSYLRAFELVPRSFREELESPAA